MSDSNRPLIVGAGPVGLGAALFLARQGRAVRIVEMRDKPSQQSKALAVNPRTLDILEPSGVTRRMLSIGLPVHGVRFNRGERNIAAVRLDGIHPRYPFMLALSQATTEKLLTDALVKAGGRVERGVKMVDCKAVPGGVEASLEPAQGGPRETVRCPWMLAADGAHSVARQQMGIEFEGSSFEHPWYLADVPLRTELALDQVHIFLLKDGAFLFLIPVMDEGWRQRRDPLWRVIMNRPDPLAHLVQAEQAGPAVWESSFHISHRLNATLARGGVYFAGDAGHIHSPAGARGMNLGLEDAWVFAELVRANRLADYDGLRRPVDRQVVQRVELLSRIIVAESWFTRFVRSYVFPLAMSTPMLRARIMPAITGLDHDLPEISPSKAAPAVAPIARGTEQVVRFPVKAHGK